MNNIIQIILKEAEKAYNCGEVPVGAAIVKNGKIISKAHNMKEKKNSVMAHAEIIAIERASKKLNNWRLDECDIYVTLEPCSMCASAIHQARISNIYFLTKNTTSGKSNCLDQILIEKNCNKKTNIFQISQDEKSKNLLQDFFKNRR